MVTRRFWFIRIGVRISEDPDMTVSKLEIPPHRRRESPVARTNSECEIIIFPGVRIDRQPAEVPPYPAQTPAAQDCE